MITWLDLPFKGTNIATGFEVLIHGFLTSNGSFYAICVGEDGLLATELASSIALDWRFTRGRGWHSLDDPDE